MYVFLINVIILIFSTNIYFYCNIRYVILSDAFNKDILFIYFIIYSDGHCEAPGFARW